MEYSRRAEVLIMLVQIVWSRIYRNYMYHVLKNTFLTMNKLPLLMFKNIRLHYIFLKIVLTQQNKSFILAQKAATRLKESILNDSISSSDRIKGL